jgi:hypothetical protein
VDFGAITGALADSITRADSDVKEVPVIAYAIGISYNVHVSPTAQPQRYFSGTDLTHMQSQLPEVLGKGTLVFNLTTLADIMLGIVDKWDHPAIRELNPALASYLPSQFITAVVPGSTPLILQVFLKSMRDASELFNSTVTNHRHRSLSLVSCPHQHF